MQINSLSRLLKTVSLPAQKETPVAEKNKVVGKPTNVPVNRQAAMIMRPNRCWLSEPVPDKPKSKQDKEVERLKADLKAERNSHASTRDDLGNCRHDLRVAKSEIQRLSEMAERLKDQCAIKDDTIRQLEDLKL
jgi:septal ring factor EnvC (AmiA/AmiB activator)